ncbi:MAG: Enolase [Candidatus Wolfebacteria bacterium GW2011_GWC1_37_10]|uniref:Enolase n=1 Tax=Candidatus Wolfebacteria bacterium GW2011_GWC1_37_10 TaxID=1619010 RepID=A0A0G0IC81_9BACT|nr:MAG: Enolase [Candidatus Wolfebacteria bacterium GW2011_GWC1_37_10]
MKILNVNLRIILDSRGKDTLEAELKNGNFSAKASVPAGKSTGKHEAFVLEPKKALEKFEEIKNLILEKDFENQEAFDNFLIQLDGTENKSNLGGNLILSLSLAFARLKAKSDNLELFEYISKLQNLKPKIKNLKPIFNVINGGAHATNKQSQLDFQEFQIIPEVEDFNLAFSIGKIFYRKLGDYLIEKFGKENVFLGDEAGYSAPFQSNEEALEILAEVIEKYKHPLRIGLDVAASQFFKGDYYLIGGKKYSAEELKEYYLKLIETYNILSIEDPFSEESFDNFAKLTSGLNRNNILVITDDLTTTNSKRLKTAISQKSGNTILIKLNQIGTLTETLKTIRLAYENNWQTIVSHRSGETVDDFIVDLAVGVNAWGLKSGAPAKPERLAKYERLLAIANKTSFQ